MPTSFIRELIWVLDVPPLIYLPATGFGEAAKYGPNAWVCYPCGGFGWNSGILVLSWSSCGCCKYLEVRERALAPVFSVPFPINTFLKWSLKTQLLVIITSPLRICGEIKRISLFWYKKNEMHAYEEPSESPWKMYIVKKKKHTWNSRHFSWIEMNTFF